MCACACAGRACSGYGTLECRQVMQSVGAHLPSSLDFIAQRAQTSTACSAAAVVKLSCSSLACCSAWLFEPCMMRIQELGGMHPSSSSRRPLTTASSALLSLMPCQEGSGRKLLTHAEKASHLVCPCARSCWTHSCSLAASIDSAQKSLSLLAL